MVLICKNATDFGISVSLTLLYSLHPLHAIVSMKHPCYVSVANFYVSSGTLNPAHSLTHVARQVAWYDTVLLMLTRVCRLRGVIFVAYYVDKYLAF